MEKNINCFLDIPYPNPPEKIASKNEKIVSYLFSASYENALKYISQSISLYGKNLNYSRILECLAITEAKHFRLLGHCLSKNNYPIRIKRGFLSSPFIDSRAIIIKNIENKIKRIQEYEIISKGASGSECEEIFSRLLLDEKHHLKILLMLKD